MKSKKGRLKMKIEMNEILTILQDRENKRQSLEL